MGFWYLAHIAGFTLWVGGGAAAMLVGIRGKREDRAAQAFVVRLLTGIHRVLMLPGIVLTILSGGYLSVPASRAATGPSSWLMLMQITGVIAAILVLFVSLPALSRLSRISPLGDTAPVFDGLRKRVATSGMVAGTLGLIALISGVFHKY
ncbi:MAG TPA: hypothetical protein VG692_04710 [Gemmatimonadales bacterium]|nr:hypothetical protein [Gemmatimonadales bacterium]